jgi:hypothetical protein
MKRVEVPIVRRVLLRRNGVFCPYKADSELNTHQGEHYPPPEEVALSLL